MKISVLIPTIGREEEVIHTVECLTKQSRLPDQIVIVDQNQPSFPKLDQFLSSIPYVKHVHSPPVGIVNNYNSCLKNADHEIVLFLDDDVDFNSELIAAHLKNYENHDPQLGGVAGKVNQPKGDEDPKNLKEVGIYHRFSGRVVGNFNYDQRKDVELAPGGNMSFKKEILEQIQGFDNEFEGNGYFFESDASLRVIKEGYRIVFDPSAEVDHLMAPRGGARVPDKATHTYYFIKNGLKLYSRHSSRIGIPFYVGHQLAYAFAKASYNLDPKIFSAGVEAVIDWSIRRERR